MAKNKIVSLIRGFLTLENDPESFGVDEIKIEDVIRPGEADGCFSLGFGRCSFFSSLKTQPGKTVADEPCARAVYIEDGTSGSGVFFVSVDVDTIDKSEVDHIRKIAAAGFDDGASHGIFILATGNRAAESIPRRFLRPDDPVCFAAIRALRDAYAAKKRGLLYRGEVDVRDGDDIGRMVRLRFSPFDSSGDLFILFFDSPVGTLSGKNVISAGFPAYLCLKLSAVCGADCVLFPMSNADPSERSRSKNPLEAVKSYGRDLAECACAIDDESLVEPCVISCRADFYAELDPAFPFEGDGRTEPVQLSGRAFVPLEMSLTKIGDLSLIIRPFKGSGSDPGYKVALTQCGYARGKGRFGDGVTERYDEIISSLESRVSE